MGQRAVSRGKLTDELVKIIVKEQEKLGVSSATLAEKVNLSEAVISRIRAGKRPLYVEELESLAQALGLRGSQVFREAEQALAASVDPVTLAWEIAANPDAYDLAANTKRDQDLYEGLGEEGQTPPHWDKD